MAREQATDATAGGQALRFCPFCREGFEGEAVCPEHDLSLVPWLSLPRARVDFDPWAPVAWYSPRLGRAWLAIGACLTLLAFTGGDLVTVDADPPLDGRMLALALHSAPKLWLVPAAALAQLSILLRRRRPVTMHGARLAAAFLGCVPPLVSAWTWQNASEALVELGARTGQALVPRPGIGAILLAMAAVCAWVGAARFGAPDRRE